VPGLERFPAAQDWLDHAAAAARAQAPPNNVATFPATLEEQRQYQQFLEWRRLHAK
jgi:hypothetical protein